MESYPESYFARYIVAKIQRLFRGDHGEAFRLAVEPEPQGAQVYWPEPQA
jgi:hypothetical protein